ncbi:Ig-like domain-containing protein [Corallococcus terminator]
MSTPACIQVPDITPVQGEVHIRTPEATAYTKGVLDIGLEVTGHRPDRVELLWDGEVLAVLESPYTYAWDTTGETEGEHRLRARVVFGETVFAGEERVVVVDRTAPQVVSRSPEPGADDVWVKSPIQAVFSEPMKASTVTSASVRLTVGGVEVVRTVSLSGDGKTMTVVPGTPISAPTSAAIALTSAVTDLAGNEVSNPSEAWNWALPYWIPWGATNVSLPLGLHDTGIHRIDSSGRLLATWPLHTDPSGRPQLNRWGGTDWEFWGGTYIDSAIMSSNEGPPLLLDDTGNPVVAWVSAYTHDKSLIHIRRWTTGVWQQLESPTPEGTGLPVKLHPTLQWTPAGQLAIAWVEHNATQQKVCVSILTEHQWTPVGACLADTLAGPPNPHLSLNFTSTGIPVVAWLGEGSTSAATEIKIHYHSEGKWQAMDDDRDTEPGKYILTHPGPNNSLYLVGLSPRGLPTTYDLHTYRYSLDPDATGGAIGVFQPASETASIRNFSIITDKDERLVIVWEEAVPQGGTKLHLRRWSHTSWDSLEDAAPLVGSLTVIPSSLQTTPDGSLVLSWIEQTQSDTHIHIKRFNE